MGKRNDAKWIKNLWKDHKKYSNDDYNYNKRISKTGSRKSESGADTVSSRNSSIHSAKLPKGDRKTLIRMLTKFAEQKSDKSAMDILPQKDDNDDFDNNKNDDNDTFNND